jgi:protein-arginine kinase activator protein McsA
MIKENYSLKTVETKVVESTDIICDECGATIAHYTEDGTVYKSYFDDYYDVVTGHNDWGNDSYESRKELQVCPQCVDKIIDAYKWRSLRRYNTEYVEISHVHTLPNRGEE